MGAVMLYNTVHIHTTVNISKSWLDRSHTEELSRNFQNLVHIVAFSIAVSDIVGNLEKVVLAKAFYCLFLL